MRLSLVNEIQRTVQAVRRLVELVTIGLQFVLELAIEEKEMSDPDGEDSLPSAVDDFDNWKHQ